MSDRVPAEISIGGKIPAALVNPLCQAITDEFVALDWGDGQFQPTGADDLLNARLERNGAEVLWLCHDQALLGQFDGLEKFLQRHRVAFRRLGDATCEYDRGLVQYHPKLGLVSVAANGAGEPVISVAPLWAIETDLTRAIELVHRSDQGAWAALRAVHKHFSKLLPPKFPALEPFEIVE